MVIPAPVPGQTPPDPDESAGLLPKHITTQAQLNQWEQLNILRAQRWATRYRGELLDEVFLRELHKRMYGDTWAWAGTFRRTDKSIGVPWEQVGMRLRQLLDNQKHLIENRAYAIDESAVRFHRDLVWIHPFPNGNGRHARLMADLLVRRLGGTRFGWGAGSLVTAGEARTQYICALRRADQGDYAPLLVFART